MKLNEAKDVIIKAELCYEVKPKYDIISRGLSYGVATARRQSMRRIVMKKQIQDRKQSKCGTGERRMVNRND